MEKKSGDLDSPEMKEIHDEAISRFAASYEADADERELAVKDIEFRAGKQWPDDIVREWEEQGRTPLTINEMQKYVDQVIGDKLQNDIGIKLYGRDSDSDPETAELFGDIIRGIEANCNAQQAYNWALQCAATCGRGYIKVATDFINDYSFDQDIFIRRVENPLSVYFDNGSTDHLWRDAEFVFICEQMSYDRFKRLYPDAAYSSFDSMDSAVSEYWIGKNNTIRIADYFRKVKNGKRTLYLLETGEIVMDKPDKSVRVIDTRAIDDYQIEHYRMSPAEMLSGKSIWPCKYFPIVPVWGKMVNVAGARTTHGVVRHAIDPQRMQNYWYSKATEVVALTPDAPFMVTIDEIKGLEDMWNELGHTKRQYMTFNPDPRVNNSRPQRNQPPTVPTGYLEMMRTSSAKIMDTTGIYESSIGSPSNEKSGEAIKQRRSGSDRGNYEYMYNLAQSVQHVGRIVMELMPKIYTGARIMRAIGLDGDSRPVSINNPQEPIGESIDINDIMLYDVSVSVGTSYTTKRQEAADRMQAFMSMYPESAPLLGDLLAKMQDWPMADEIEKRLKAMLPPEIKEVVFPDDKEETPPVDMMPPQDAGAVPPPPVDPLAEIQIAQEQAKVRKLEAEADKAEAEASKVMLEVNAMANNAQ